MMNWDYARPKHTLHQFTCQETVLSESSIRQRTSQIHFCTSSLLRHICLIHQHISRYTAGCSKYLPENLLYVSISTWGIIAHQSDENRITEARHRHCLTCALAQEELRQPRTQTHHSYPLTPTLFHYHQHRHHFHHTEFIPKFLFNAFKRFIDDRRAYATRIYRTS